MEDQAREGKSLALDREQVTSNYVDEARTTLEYGLARLEKVSTMRDVEGAAELVRLLELLRARLLLELD